MSAETFDPINPGYARTFTAGRMSLGLVVPIERYDQSPMPTMERQLERIRMAEELGFAAVWLRDVPLNVANFGDAGQVFDPFVYLGLLSGATRNIALGVASLVLPLRHPLHVAKAAASVDRLSNGRLLLGIASGDRPEEYPAMALDHASRGARFRDSFDYIRKAAAPWPRFESAQGRYDGFSDLIPKPYGERLPLLMTGGSRQDPDWLASHGDGWILYPRPAELQGKIIADWRARSRNARGTINPAMQPLYIDLVDNPPPLPQPLHLGWRLGVEHLRDMLFEVEASGINHLAFNLRLNTADTEATLEKLAAHVLPHFPTTTVRLHERLYA